jgi:hypothetical protein
MKRKIKSLLAKRPFKKTKPEEALQEAIQNIPRITNETVAEHREEVLGSARKFIYPLQHSLKKIVSISAIIFVVLLISFIVYCILALYRFGSSSTFIYRVSQVVPFPVAKAGSDFVAYENYLFELRHYTHYYQTQQKLDFDTKSGRQQLDAFRKTALQAVIDDAYVKQLAKRHKISVSNNELDNQISLLREQNRLGGSNQIFEDVLREFWGWSLHDFKRKLRQQILVQKVVSALDRDTHDRAQIVLNGLQNGGNFAELAQKYSEDPSTKNSGGEYDFTIERTNRDLSPQVIDAIFKTRPGKMTNIIETPLGLEILLVQEREANVARAAHIFFAFEDISTYIQPLKDKKAASKYISP